ncbi:hypothetical protein JCGZ_04382 [Jatropha curcas]|uniref:EF-hand domain-containing protein n=1 Tax=Jatropha curcas TaxID=180498 RepID=A0A067KQP1_JATCU|nr:probable calcium-binding protein CML41 [Jatropha curcas]KDP38457.1 hypothetical protein JCGZ_04382 [Jatropha curcas]
MATAIVSKSSKWLPRTPSFKLITSSLPRIISSKSKTSSKSRPSKQDEELQIVFRYFDKDGDGKISSEELGAYFTSIGEPMSNANVQRVIKDFDTDGDDLLEFGDFYRLVEGDKITDRDDDLRIAFEVFEGDNKGGGCITPRGLQQAFNRLGDSKSLEECAAMIRVFDLDGNGVLDFHEFYKMMT